MKNYLAATADGELLVANYGPHGIYPIIGNDPTAEVEYRYAEASELTKVGTNFRPLIDMDCQEIWKSEGELLKVMGQRDDLFLPIVPLSGLHLLWTHPSGRRFVIRMRIDAAELNQPIAGSPADPNMQQQEDAE